MATIGEPISVLHVKDAILESANECLENQYLIVTHKTKYISVVQFDTQKTTSSWSVRRGQHVTCPTVWTLSDGFITVIDKKEIRIWSKDEVNFEKCKKKHLKTAIHRILNVKDYEPIVVCENGAVDFLSKIKEKQTDGNLKDTDIIIKCQAFVIKDRPHILCLIQNQEKEMFINCHTLTTEGPNTTWASQTLDVPRDVSVLSCDLKQFGSEIRCYILYKNEHLYHVEISPESSTVSCHKLCNISHVQNSVALIILNSTHIAVSGIQHNNKVGLGIYDTRFNVLETFKAFTEQVTDDIKLFHCYNCLFTSYGKTLYMYPYSCQRSTVANILGKQNIQMDDIINCTWKGGSWTISNTENEKIRSEETAKNIMEKMSDSSQVWTYPLCKETFQKIKSITDIASHNRLMLQFVQICLNKVKPFPEDEIRKMIENHAVPSILIPHLFDTLIKNNKTDLLLLSLQSVREVPEPCMCKTLQYFLSLEEDKVTNPKEGCSLSQNQKNMVNMVLQTPFNDVFLVECIRTLSFKNVLTLLEYLYHLIVCEDDDDAEEDKPSLAQVVDWICAVLDGHFTQLIISPDAREVLVNLHSVIETQVQFYNELSSLEALLLQLRARCDIPQKKMVGGYCIEVLHIL